MNNERLQQIRENERISHIETYQKNELFAPGSWLAKPVKTVTECFPHFRDYEKIKALDLGCGVGRNSIPFAQEYSEKCSIDCVDILDLAIEKLMENAQKHKVTQNINGFVKPLEEFKIAENSYDRILAVSALEHVESEEAFVQKLIEIERGLNTNGIVCLVINSEVTEFDFKRNRQVAPQFEVNLPAEKLERLLDDIFADWHVRKRAVRLQEYEIPRENGTGEMCIVHLTSKVVTFVAEKVCGRRNG